MTDPHLAAYAKGLEDAARAFPALEMFRYAREVVSHGDMGIHEDNIRAIVSIICMEMPGRIRKLSPLPPGSRVVVVPPEGSGNNQRPRKLVAEVDVGGGAWMSIPDPRAVEDGGLEWCLRYTCGNLPNNVQFQAASVVESFDYLLSGEIPTQGAIGLLRIMRRARAALRALTGGDDR